MSNVENVENTQQEGAEPDVATKAVPEAPEAPEANEAAETPAEPEANEEAETPEPEVNEEAETPEPEANEEAETPEPEVNEEVPEAAEPAEAPEVVEEAGPAAVEEAAEQVKEVAAKVEDKAKDAAHRVAEEVKELAHEVLENRKEYAKQAQKWLPCGILFFSLVLTLTEGAAGYGMIVLGYLNVIAYALIKAYFQCTDFTINPNTMQKSLGERLWRSSAFHMAAVAAIFGLLDVSVEVYWIAMGVRMFGDVVSLIDEYGKMNMSGRVKENKYRKHIVAACEIVVVPRLLLGGLFGMNVSEMIGCIAYTGLWAMHQYAYSRQHEWCYATAEKKLKKLGVEHKDGYGEYVLKGCKLAGKAGAATKKVYPCGLLDKSQD